MWAKIKSALNSTTGTGMKTLDQIMAREAQGAYYNYMVDKYGVGYTLENEVAVAPRVLNLTRDWITYTGSTLKNLVFAPETSLFQNHSINSFMGVEELYLPCANIMESYSVATMPVLKKVVFGSELKSLEKQAFYSCPSLKKIYYHGTISQWRAISKADNWKENTVMVYCYDGGISE